MCSVAINNPSLTTVDYILRFVCVCVSHCLTKHMTFTKPTTEYRGITQADDWGEKKVRVYPQKSHVRFKVMLWEVLLHHHCFYASLTILIDLNFNALTFLRMGISCVEIGLWLSDADITLCPYKKWEMLSDVGAGCADSKLEGGWGWGVLNWGRPHTLSWVCQDAEAREPHPEVRLFGSTM